MTTQQQDNKINQTIHEARGLCYHEWRYDNCAEAYICVTCKEETEMPSCNPSYTSDWLAWGAALEWAEKQEWWEKFAYDWQSIDPFHEDLLNPQRGATALVKFIDENPEYFKKEVGK